MLNKIIKKFHLSYATSLKIKVCITNDFHWFYLHGEMSPGVDSRELKTSWIYCAYSTKVQEDGDNDINVASHECTVTVCDFAMKNTFFILPNIHVVEFWLIHYFSRLSAIWNSFLTTCCLSILSCQKSILCQKRIWIIENHFTLCKFSKNASRHLSRCHFCIWMKYQ